MSITGTRLRPISEPLRDGPYAESKESLVGYWIVDVEDKDRAIAIASRIVDFVKVPIEVRRVMDAPPDF